MKVVSGAGIVLNSRLNMSGRSGGGGICGGRGGYVVKCVFGLSLT